MLELFWLAVFILFLGSLILISSVAEEVKEKETEEKPIYRSGYAVYDICVDSEVLAGVYYDFGSVELREALHGLLCANSTQHLLLLGENVISGFLSRPVINLYDFDEMLLSFVSNVEEVFGKDETKNIRIQ